jgi:hypothetical protein
MVNRDPQLLLDDIARAEQRLAELTDERDRVLRHVSERRGSSTWKPLMPNGPTPLCRGRSARAP